MAHLENITISGTTNYFPDCNTSFKQLQLQMILELPSQKPDVEHLLHAHIDVDASNTQVISIPSAVSFEGQVLTGTKLIVGGRVLHKLEYIADNSIQSVHAVEISSNYSTYIMLDKNYTSNNIYDIQYYIEDVFIKQLDSKTIFSSIALLLAAVPLNLELIQGPKKEENFLSNCESQLEESFDPLIKKEDYFTQINCRESIALPAKNPDLRKAISVIIDSEIISMRFIQTIKGTSKEGQRLAGCKAILQLRLKQKILYASDTPEQSVYALENICYTSAYIVLPTLIEGTPPDILYKNKMLLPKITIEDASLTELNKRSIFKNITICIKLELLPTYEICCSSYKNCTNSDLFLSYEDGSHITAITSLSNGKNIKPCWSPNGSQIAYLKALQQGYTLNCFNMKSCSHRQLVSPKAFENISSYSWHKNSQQIIFSGLRDKSKELYLLDMSNNSYCQLTYGKGVIKSYYPKISPKGSYVAYLSSATAMVSLCYSAIDGSNPGSVWETGEIKDYDWLTNEEGFVYIASKNEARCEIHMALLNSSRKTCIFRSDSLYGLKRILISPDGDFIAFVGVSKDSDDIYLYDFSTGMVKNITRHRTPLKISDMAWKIDSSKIYYTAKELGYYYMHSIDICTKASKRISNAHSSFMQLSYRPKIR